MFRFYDYVDEKGIKIIEHTIQPLSSVLLRGTPPKKLQN